MTGQWLYLVIGAVLVLLLAAITIQSYSRKRKRQVEAPKYKMLDDE